jgi:hypothetical protein
MTQDQAANMISFRTQGFAVFSIKFDHFTQKLFELSVFPL